MDKLVKRVTVVQGSGEHREAKTVYKDDDDMMDDDGQPNFSKLERSVRQMLKSRMEAAQDAYKQHVESAEKGGNTWMADAPGQFIKARQKAMKEMSKSMPFKMPKIVFEDADKDEED